MSDLRGQIVPLGEWGPNDSVEVGLVVRIAVVIINFIKVTKRKKRKG